MPKLPTTLGETATPTPQRGAYRPSVTPGEGVDYSQASSALSAYGRSVQDKAAAGADLGASAKGLGDSYQKYQDREAILDASNRENTARKASMDFLYGNGDSEGLYSSEGGNAIGAEKKFNERFKTIRESALEGVKNPTAQRALEKSLNELEISHLDNVKRFEASNRKSYAGELAASRAGLDDERVGLEWNNDNTFQTALSDKQKSVETMAKIKGMSPEGTEVAIQAAQSGLYKTRFTAMLNSEDPAVVGQAMENYEKAQKDGKLTFADVNQLDTAFDAVRPKVAAFNEFNKFRTGDTFATTQGDKIFTAMLNVESGGQHYQPDGSITTSPKGAFGVAQLMPDTAKMMAKEMGIDEKLLVDPGVNAAVGQKYFQKMQDKFGDNTLAVLSYNWGPGNVDKHIEKVGDPRKGEVSYDYFLATVPSKEARQYVPKVMASTGGGYGMLDKQQAEAKAAGMEPKAGEEFLKLVDNQNKSNAASRASAIKGTMDHAFQFMQTSGTGWESMPNGIRAAAVDSGIAAQLMNYTGKTDPETATMLYGMDAKTLKETDLNTPGIRLSLSTTDYQKWQKKQQSLDNSALMVTTDERNAQVKQAFAKRAYNPDKKAVKAQMVRFNELLDLEVDGFAQTNNGRYPNGAEVQKMVDSLFIKRDTNGKSWLTGWGGTKAPFDVQITDIGKKDQTAIKLKLESRGLPATEAAIIETYISGIE